MEKNINAVTKVLQPFKMEILPIRKLVLFNFEKAPDEIYSGLELQYLINNEVEKGYRLIAYRKDEYVDLYDEARIAFKQEARCDVCGKGLKHYQEVTFENPYFELGEQGISVAFALQDYMGRKIEVMLKEHGKRKSRPFDLIAPVGVSSEKPVSFPAFAMYQFDLVRKRNTEVEVKIDGKSMILDPFPAPIPKDGQMRHFMRYGYDCELIEFGKAVEERLEPCELNEGKVNQGNITAHYKRQDGKYEMDSLGFNKSRHLFRVTFEDAFPDVLRMQEGEIKGRFKMEMDASMGYFAGQYQVVKQRDKVEIMMEPSEGWVVKNKSLFTKMLLMKKSVFREWPKTYRYLQTIDLKTYESATKWIRLEKGIKWSI